MTWGTKLIFCTVRNIFLACIYRHFIVCILKVDTRKGELRMLSTWLKLQYFPRYPNSESKVNLSKLQKKSPELHFKKQTSRQNMWAWLLNLRSRQYLWLSPWNVSLPKARIWLGNSCNYLIKVTWFEEREQTNVVSWWPKNICEIFI